ncbi:nucleoside kinase [Clostridium fermenticellae]|uniref:Nucleoside kinase n=1 Tax=Clostridium fermenticellae TaxID=2068654 RepID=A0A386H7B4_9CLOT|nr:nucleoside kinase [Clostridium fermenticellae]AYD41488.1 nucleoside kinase [Clostridium fermenticellae]
MDKIEISISDKKLLVEKGTDAYSIINKSVKNGDIPVILSKINGEYKELTTSVYEDSIVEPVYMTNRLAIKAYIRTLQFILIKSVSDLFKDAKVIIEHSIEKALFGKVYKATSLDASDVEKIKNRMQQIIDSNIPIRKLSFDKKDALKIFEGYKMDDKLRLLKHVSSDKLKLYELDGRYDYFYGSMAYSTGAIKTFDLKYYKPGFILRYPSAEDPFRLPGFVDQKKLSNIFYETEQWGNILGVGDVGSLNDKVANGKIGYMIRVAEALHEKKIAYIADEITKKKDVKIVLIAGPSSSGKTTFARRLGIQLRVNGLAPIPISLDDYFVDREHTPKDENGEYDFESIYALDLKLFNSNLSDILHGKEVELPFFNFKTGMREWVGKKIKLPSNGLIIIEGIHGLNEMLTSSIPYKNKFKIYISALTQLNIDNHNRIATTDVRIVRRIVRDSLYRGYSAEDTLKMWPSIKRGEEKNIFIFQENADVMFNSTLVYELCVLKKYALKELEKINSTSPVYYEMLRLKSFLHFFRDVDVDLVPDNSILREFVGGSCFYKY